MSQVTPDTASAVVKGKGLSHIVGAEYGKCVLASCTRVPEHFRRTEGISEALTRRTESMNHAAPAAWAGGEGGVGLTVPAQLSPDRRAGGLSTASSPVYNGRWSSPSERLDHSGSC